MNFYDLVSEDIKCNFCDIPLVKAITRPAQAKKKKEKSTISGEGSDKILEEYRRS